MKSMTDHKTFGQSAFSNLFTERPSAGSEPRPKRSDPEPWLAPDITTDLPLAEKLTFVPITVALSDVTESLYVPLKLHRWASRFAESTFAKPILGNVATANNMQKPSIALHRDNTVSRMTGSDRAVPDSTWRPRANHLFTNVCVTITHPLILLMPLSLID